MSSSIKNTTRRLTVGKSLNIFLIFFCTSFFGIATCEAPEHPWDKEVYVYQHDQEMMRNLKDANKDITAEKGHGFVCLPPTVFKNMNAYVIDKEDQLKACQEGK